MHFMYFILIHDRVCPLRLADLISSLTIVRNQTPETEPTPSPLERSLLQNTRRPENKVRWLQNATVIWELNGVFRSSSFTPSFGCKPDAFRVFSLPVSEIDGCCN
eukprot:c13879_g1_i4.p1 GENE.c13879_g1_i4~~c13879_g1_i4.p1  ORF type:complete len:105 (-),score=14.39 c13879_g1_i4:707-1021(-)